MEAMKIYDNVLVAAHGHNCSAIGRRAKKATADTA
jgi:hypothetical protein